MSWIMGTLAFLLLYTPWRIWRSMRYRNACQAEVKLANHLANKTWRIVVARDLLAKRAKMREGYGPQYTFPKDWGQKAEDAGLIGADGSIMWATVEAAAAQTVIGEEL